MKVCEYCGEEIKKINSNGQKYHIECYKEYKKKYHKEYYRTEKRQKKLKEYNNNPLIKKKRLEYEQKESTKLTRRKYAQKPEVKERRKIQARERRKDTSKHKRIIKHKRISSSKKENREKNKKYCRDYHKREDVINRRRRKTKEPLEQIKIKARKSANKKIIIPEKKLCEMCLIKKAVERHHNDYMKPLDVKFLCKKCHSKLRRISL